jgi:prepilin-type N-terminal cleavage/methylation domain-containing protein
MQLWKLSPIHAPFKRADVMKGCRYKTGFTLLEMLIVVALIALLATMVVGIATRIDSQSKQRGLENIFAVLDSALEEYYDYWNGFPDPNLPAYPNHSAALYGQLYSTPASRQILEKINAKLLRNSPPQICDPWGIVLDYRYTLGNNFPLLVSAGPDRTFGTADDITNR